MAVDRQTVYLALFALASLGEGLGGRGALSSVVYTSRRVKLFNAVGADQRPSLMQAEHDELTAQVTALPYKRTFKAHWICYIATGRNADLIPADEVNALQTAIETVLAPPPSDPGYPKRNTLGGLVHHCYIDGQTFKDPGDLDGDGLLMVPITILAP